MMVFAECPLNCEACQVIDSSDTTATCTTCNDYYNLVTPNINNVNVDGNCYRMYCVAYSRYVRSSSL